MNNLVQQSSKLFVKLYQQQQQDDSCNNHGIICDTHNCRVCVRTERPCSSATSTSTEPKPKWWKAIVKNTTEQWKDLPVETIFTPETSNRCLASQCCPMLINAALEGMSTCLAVSSSNCEASDQTLYGKGATSADNKSLLVTSVLWLFDLIDTFRVTRSSVRFSVRVSAVRLSINNAEITTTDLLEHIAQDGSSGDIPKLLGIGRISGPRELRASSAKQALAYVDAAVKASSSSSSPQPGIFVFSLNVYQYQIERQPNGSETISGGRGQFHIVDLSKVTGKDENSDFSSLQEKVVGTLSKNTPSTTNILPTAFASLTGQILREFQRCRMCHFLAIISAKDPNSRQVLDLYDSFVVVPSSQQSSTKRSSAEQRQTSASYDSATLPRLSSFTSFTDSQHSMSSSITGRLSHCVSGSELSIHTVIHRPSPPPPPTLTMQNSFTSQGSNGAPPSMATSNFSSSFSRPSCYSDSETESISRLRQPSLAPMQPLDFQQNRQLQQQGPAASDNEESGFQQQSQSHTGNSISANCSPAKQPNKEKEHHKSKYQRLKRFASSRLRRQMEQQKMWAMVSASKALPEKTTSAGGEIWIDGPGAKMQQVEDWIDGPLVNMRNNVASNPQFHQQLCQQLNLESQQRHHRSLPRAKQHQSHHPQPVPLVTMRNRQKAAAKNGHRPPSISCSSENLFVDSGYFQESAAANHRQNLAKREFQPAKLQYPHFLHQQQQQPQRPATMGIVVDPLGENNGDFPGQRRLVKSSLQQGGVTWGPIRQQEVLNHYHFLQQTAVEQPSRPGITFVEAKKLQQSPFMRLKNKLLGKKHQQPQQQLPVLSFTSQQRPGTTSVPSSPAVVAKRQTGHHIGLVTAAASSSNQQAQTNNNRMSRLTDTSDSGNDSGVALFVVGGQSGGLKVVATTNGPTSSTAEDALSTTKSLSSTSSGASPPSPASAGGLVSSTNPSQKTTAIALSSGSVCSHSSGRGSASSLLSHSVGGSQPSIAETSEIVQKMHVQTHQIAWAGNATSLSSVEEELASAVSSLYQTLAPTPVQQQKRQSAVNSQKMPPPLPTLHTPRQQQRRHLKLDISEVSESPSRDELLCLESLEQQLLS